MAPQLPIARRSAWTDDCLEVVCGIANAGGGRLIIDAETDFRGNVKRRSARLMKSLPDTIRQALGITCSIELVLEGTDFCMEIIIPPSEEPISFRGVFYLWKDGENTEMDDKSIDRLTAPEAEFDSKWETRPVVQAPMDELNPSLVLRFADAYEDPELDAVMDRQFAIEEKLKRAGLMTGVGIPTNAGVLILHDAPHRYIPGATVRIGFFGGRAGSPLFEDEITGSLIHQVHATVETLFDKYLPSDDHEMDEEYRYRTAINPGSTPPRDAIHEAVLNALVHKNYDSGAPIQVSVFNDRVCIENVGRPPRTWTVSALMGRHTSRPTNPNTVRVLRQQGIIDGWGNGIGTMRMDCLEAGLPEPIFELRDDETMVCFQMDQDAMLTTALNSYETPVMTPPVTRTELPEVQATARTMALQNNANLTRNDEKVLAMIDIDGRLTATRIAKNLNISESTVRRSFRRLREMGLIERVGSDKSGFWQVL